MNWNVYAKNWIAEQEELRRRWLKHPEEMPPQEPTDLPPEDDGDDDEELPETQP